jgi:apolipoprotein N-acyltransferase
MMPREPDPYDDLDDGAAAPVSVPLEYEPAMEPLRRGIVNLGPLKTAALAFSAGAVSNMAFAPYHVWPLLSVGLVLLVWLFDGAAGKGKGRLLSGFWRAWCFAFGFFVLGLSWIGNAFLVDAGQFGGFMWVGILALPALLALLWGAGGALALRFWSVEPARVLWFAVVFGLVEWVRGHLFGGFPWNTPATTWVPGGGVSQLASVVGLWGLGILTLLALACPAALADDRRTTRFGIAGRAAPVLLAVTVLGLSWAWGEQRVRTTATTAEGPVVRVVESGVPQDAKWTPGNEGLILRRFLELTGPLEADIDSGAPAEVVIWPESALPMPLLEDPQALDAVAARLENRLLIAGLWRSERFARAPRYYNSLALLDSQAPTRGPIAVYDKSRLVPFGEFVPEPFAGGLRALGFSSLSMLQSAFTPGGRPFPIESDMLPSFGPLICFEALFPGMTPRGQDRPSWIVNVSVDGWYGTGAGPEQHYVQARFRAIEEGLPLVRAASGGISAVIDAFGREVVRATPTRGITPLDGVAQAWVGKSAQARLPGSLPPTIYSRWAETGPVTIGLFLLAIWMLSRRKGIDIAKGIAP